MKYMSRFNLGLAAVLVVVVVLVSLPLPFYSHQWHKLMHILGAVLFVGNIIVSAVWMILTVFTKQASIVHFGAKVVNQADLLFTIPGVLLILINGVVMAPVFGGGNILGASWVVAALGSLTLSGIVWVGFLLRYQNQLVELSASGDQLSAEFLATFRNWGIWGGIGTILPIISLVLMVVKPILWT